MFIPSTYTDNMKEVGDGDIDETMYICLELYYPIYPLKEEEFYRINNLLHRMIRNQEVKANKLGLDD